MYRRTKFRALWDEKWWTNEKTWKWWSDSDCIVGCCPPLGASFHSFFFSAINYIIIFLLYVAYKSFQHTPHCMSNETTIRLWTITSLHMFFLIIIVLFLLYVLSMKPTKNTFWLLMMNQLKIHLSTKYYQWTCRKMVRGTRI